MAVYVWLNDSSPTRPRFRHLDAWCIAGGMDGGAFVGMRRLAHLRRTVPVWRLADGSEFAYCPNTADVKRATERCPKCFLPGGPVPMDCRWNGWRDALPSGAGVYEISWPGRRITQIGSGDLILRVGARFRATYESRFDKPNSIWWVYDLLVAGDHPKVQALPLDGRAPLGAETHYRDVRLNSGWQVSSAV